MKILLFISFLLIPLISYAEDQIITNGKRDVSLSEALNLVKESPSKDKWYQVLGAERCYVLGQDKALIIEHDDEVIALGLVKEKYEKTESDFDKYHYGPPDEEIPKKRGSIAWLLSDDTPTIEKAKYYEEDRQLCSAARAYKDAGNMEKAYEMAHKEIKQLCIFKNYSSAAETYKNIFEDYEKAVEMLEKELELHQRAGSTEYKINNIKNSIKNMRAEIK